MTSSCIFDSGSGRKPEILCFMKVDIYLRKKMQFSTAKNVNFILQQ